MLDERFAPAERGRPLPYLHSGGGCDGCLGAAADADRQHAPKAALHLPARDLMPWMMGESRVEHGRDRAMIGEAIGEVHRVSRPCAHAQVERSQTPDQQDSFDVTQDDSMRLANR